jgi:hypothetical protein
VDWSSPEPGRNYAGSTGGAYLITKDKDGEPKRKNLDMGDNPPKGAIITYYLAEEPTAPLTLSFSDAEGNEIRSFSSRKPARVADDEPGGGEGAGEGAQTPEAEKGPKAPARQGWNRFVWDLKHAPITKLEGKDPAGEMVFEGPVVPPGSYTVTLKAGETTLTQALQVVKDGRVDASDADLHAQYDLAMRIHRSADEAVRTINRMRDLRAQLDAWATRAAAAKGGEGVAEAAKGLRARVLELEKALLVPDLRAGWADRINNGTRLLEKLLSLPAVVALGEYRPTDAAEAAYNHVAAQIDEQIGGFNRLVESELPGLNKRIAELQLGAVVARA